LLQLVLATVPVKALSDGHQPNRGK